MSRLTMEEIIEHCKRKVSHIEKTFRKEHLESENCGVADFIYKEYWEHRQVAEWLEKLKQYKDKEEQGLLISLPVPIGGTVWGWEYPTIIDEDDGSTWAICDIRRAKVVPKKFHLMMLDKMGDMYFRTQAEAEEALAKMGGSNGTE